MQFLITNFITDVVAEYLRLGLLPLLSECKIKTHLKILRSFDQFSNMVCENTSERRILHAKKGDATICFYTDIELGLYLIRGDSMVLLGEVNTVTDHGSDDRNVVNINPPELDDNNVKEYMKKLTIEEFEELEEKLQTHEMVDELVWEFDMDLVI